MLRKSLILVGAAMLVASFAACDDDPAPATYGDLQVGYRVGSGNLSCEEVSIQFVRVYVIDSETDDTVVDDIFPCDATSQIVTFEGVPTGEYFVRVEGLDGDNTIIYSGELGDLITVLADQTNSAGEVVLNQLRPAIMLWVDFAEPGGCSRAEVTEVVVRIYENGSSLLFDETYDCDESLAEALLYEDLSETSTYDLRVRATNDHGEYSHEYDEFEIEVAPGSPTVVTAELEVCPSLCSQP